MSPNPANISVSLNLANPDYALPAQVHPHQKPDHGAGRRSVPGPRQNLSFPEAKGLRQYPGQQRARSGDMEAVPFHLGRMEVTPRSLASCQETRLEASLLRSVPACSKKHP